MQLNTCVENSDFFKDYAENYRKYIKSVEKRKQLWYTIYNQIIKQ